jgi:hypothetical protein
MNPHPANTTVELYSLETVEQITRISRSQIILYREYGLVTGVARETPPGVWFDDEAIHRLRRLAFLAAEYGVNENGLRTFAALLAELERLREEVRFLRG